MKPKADDPLLEELESLKNTFDQYLLLFHKGDQKITVNMLQELNYAIYNKECLLASIYRTKRNKDIFGI